MGEDKELVTYRLAWALKATEAGSDIIRMYYQENEGFETVTIEYENGHRKAVNVSMDSGIALIRDVLREIT